MVAKAARKPRKRAGRPVDPESLRQSGERFEARWPAELLASARAAAGDEGLSAWLRRLAERELSR